MVCEMRTLHFLKCFFHFWSESISPYTRATWREKHPNLKKQAIQLSAKLESLTFDDGEYFLKYAVSAGLDGKFLIMGIKDLWTLIAPYCERKPLYELQGKIVAVDLAGWVCESLNVVDYFIHPKQYLKNLFFRTCYLLLAGIVPVFVLEGKAPDLKQDTINKRNNLQFRGNKPREETNHSNPPRKAKNGRTRFNHVLKECESLLQAMGLQCIQAPGEAEAFCAHLNANEQVYGIISQDSDCFAYGAIRVFRNFSVSTQGTSAAAGGAVDIYDMEKICNGMDFGQNKIIAMALLCGCDYCPGVDGVGRDSVIKLFAKYKNSDILERLKSWRANDLKYTELEMKVDDKNICSSCGHYGKALSHSKNGCSLCRTPKGCDSSLWKEERLAIKSELVMRKKALTQNEFPCDQIINEFLQRRDELPQLDLRWRQPNVVRFVKVIGHSLQWTEIYCFEKILPLLTRWLIYHHSEICEEQPNKGILCPDFIRKKRTLKGIPSYEIVWKDDDKYFDGLIPDSQLNSYRNDNPKGIETLFSTIEPADIFEKSFPTVTQEFLAKQKKPKTRKKQPRSKLNLETDKQMNNNSLDNMSDLLKATEEVEKGFKKRRKKIGNDLQKIDKFLLYRSTPPRNSVSYLPDNCSTPKASKVCLSDLDDDIDDFNFSDIIKNIILKPSYLKDYNGKQLKYENVKYLNRSQDDLDLLPKKKRVFPSESPVKTSKRIMLNDAKHNSFTKLCASQDDLIEECKNIENVVDKFLARERKVSVIKNSSASLNKSKKHDEASDSDDSDCVILE